MNFTDFIKLKPDNLNKFDKFEVIGSGSKDFINEEPNIAQIFTNTSFSRIKKKDIKFLVLSSGWIMDLDIILSGPQFKNISSNELKKVRIHKSKLINDLNVDYLFIKSNSSENKIRNLLKKKRIKFNNLIIITDRDIFKMLLREVGIINLIKIANQIPCSKLKLFLWIFSLGKIKNSKSMRPSIGLIAVLIFKGVTSILNIQPLELNGITGKSNEFGFYGNSSKTLLNHRSHLIDLYILEIFFGN